MRCTRLLNCVSIFLLLSVMHFEIDALKEEVPEPLNRRNIMEDLWSLLGLKPPNNTIQSRQNPNINTNSTTIPSNSSSINNTMINDNSSFIINNINETYTDINTTSFTNFTDNFISNISVSNNNSEISISGNDSLISNFTLTALNESYYFTEPTNDTSMNTTTNLTEEVNNINTTTNGSLFTLNQNPVNLLNRTINDTSTQQYLNTSNEISMDSNSTILYTEHGFLPNTPTTTDTWRIQCSISPNFSNTCHLPSEFVNQSDSLTTFIDVENKLSNSYLQSCLLKYCSRGEWCLGSAMDSLINESLNLSSKFCSSTFLTCLRMTAAEYLPCADYEVSVKINLYTI